ncbi:PLC-like phosphodiesterase [Backusella circina FSU 941]|nr:PLC-like phosphodiesterase [Backusella circina FSU 941]
MSTIQQSPAIPDVIGHRGYAGEYPENTFISFQESIKAGATALEGDIRLTKDNEIIMMHDLTLQRTTTGTGSIRDHTWNEIQAYTTKKGNQPIPRLKEVLDFMDQIEDKREGFYMIIDIKFDNPIEILDVLSTLLNGYPHLQNHLVIGIWNLEFLNKAKSLFGHHYQLCFIGLSVSASRHHFLPHVDCVSLPFAALCNTDGRKLIDEAHALGKRVFAWTINSDEQAKSCVVLDLDGIVGDHVCRMKELMTIDDERLYQEYADASDQFLKSKRKRAQHYLLKKGMALASWKVVGA